MNKKLNNKQQEKLQKLNEHLLSLNKGLISESHLLENKKEKANLFNKKLYEMKKLMKPINESFMRNFSQTKNNVKIAEYNINGDQSQIIFFLLPEDERLLEVKNGREIDFKLEDFIYFVEKTIDNKDFNTSDANDPEGTNYFDFDTYWNQMDEAKKIDDLKGFVIYKIKELGGIPELK